MQCEKVGIALLCQYKLLQFFCTIDSYTANKRWYYQKEVRFEKPKKRNVALWWYEEIMVNLLIIGTDGVVCFVEEFF